MSILKISGIMGVLLTLALPFSPGPAPALDCGLALPCAQSVDYDGSALAITNTNGTAIKGAGHGFFGVGLLGSGVFIGVSGESGNGLGVLGSSTNSTGVMGEGPHWGVFGKSTGAYAGVYGESALKYGVHGKSTGSFAGVYGESDTGHGVSGVARSATRATNAGLYGINTGIGNGVYARSSNGKAAFFSITNAANNKPALWAQTSGAGWSGYFYASNAAGRGVYIKTQGGQGLQVVGGTKSAVVPTSQGSRALYAEEASEVYFTDYGFGKLKDGKAVIKIDPLFAETVKGERGYGGRLPLMPKGCTGKAWPLAGKRRSHLLKLI